MTKQQRFSKPTVAALAGLLAGAAGISVLWASGVEFPIYPPPGILILLAGCLFVGLATWRWAPAVGAALGLFVLVGFLISPTGIGNLLGNDGAAVATGQGIQVAGVLVALVAGLLATRRNYQVPGRP
ncbi:hypothetical protein [Flindersiella endophytica]